MLFSKAAVESLISIFGERSSSLAVREVSGDLPGLTLNTGAETQWQPAPYMRDFKVDVRGSIPLPRDATLTMLDAEMADPTTAKRKHADAESIDSSLIVVQKRAKDNDEMDTDDEAPIVCIHRFNNLDEDPDIVDDLVGVEIEVVPPNGPQSQVWLGDSDEDEPDHTGDTKMQNLDVDMESDEPECGERALCSRHTGEESASMSISSNEFMSVELSTGEEATGATLMDVESPRVDKRKRGSNQSSSSTTSTTTSTSAKEESLCPIFSRKKRGIVIAVDPMEVDDVSMAYEVNALMHHDLNGPYWRTDVSVAYRCGDLSGIDIDAQRYVTRSIMKRSGDASSKTSTATDDTNFVDEGGDMMMDEMDGVHGDGRVTQRLPTSSALDSLDEEGMSYDDDELSVMSEITTNSNVHSGMDSSNPWLGGLDVRAVDVCAERLQRVTLSEDTAAMDVDDDAGSVVCERYLLRSTLVFAPNRYMYYTRAMAKRTRSGARY